MTTTTTIPIAQPVTDMKDQLFHFVTSGMVPILFGLYVLGLAVQLIVKYIQKVALYGGGTGTNHSRTNPYEGISYSKQDLQDATDDLNWLGF